nr:pancreatic triacylglycerol lipase [Onthophagus taurus]
MILINSTLFLNTLMMVTNETVIQSSYGQDELTTYNNYLLTVGEDAPKPKCFGSYGCFDLSDPWTSNFRPESRFPEPLLKVHPRFALYTRRNSVVPIYLDMYEVFLDSDANMDLELPLYVLIHGFTDNGKKHWILSLKDKLLVREKCNIIIVDWGNASNPPYPQAVANIRLIGAVTAHLLEALYGEDEHGFDRVHCIGHSLGAHMCGYIGYQLKKDFGFTMGRITGMDPAGPHFSNTQPPVRLDKSAAKYVDIIHTDAGDFTSLAFGIQEAIGHVDFYVNGGYDQPGCRKTFSDFASTNGLVLGAQKFMACNHVRSHEIFIDSINMNPSCPYLTISCDSYEAFMNGTCFKCGYKNQHCITFGMNSYQSYLRHLKNPHFKRQVNHTQFFMTTPKSPYCKSHYKISIYVSSHEESKAHGGEIGTLLFTMHTTVDGSGKKSDKISLDKEHYHEPGGNYTYVIPGDGLKNLKAVEVEWNYNTNFINPLTWRIMATPRIYIDKIEVEALESGERITVCPKDQKPLINSDSQILLKSYCSNT